MPDRLTHKGKAYGGTPCRIGDEDRVSKPVRPHKSKPKASASTDATERAISAIDRRDTVDLALHDALRDVRDGGTLPSSLEKALLAWHKDRQRLITQALAQRFVSNACTELALPKSKRCKNSAIALAAECLTVSPSTVENALRGHKQNALAKEKRLPQRKALDSPRNWKPSQKLVRLKHPKK